jgi:hypothetical protein
MTARMWALMVVVYPFLYRRTIKDKNHKMTCLEPPEKLVSESLGYKGDNALKGAGVWILVLESEPKCHSATHRLHALESVV